MRLGLVGYAKGGRYFHAPYIAAAPGVEFVGVVTRDEGRRADVAADFPGLPVFDALEDVVAAGADTVTITTPPTTRRELVLRALAAGANVIADKPFAPSAAAAQELVDAAAHAGRALNVFHNRRWDADVATVAALLAERAVGTPWRVESRFDLDEPEGLEAGPDGGLLRDLGTHLVDQLTWLLGPVVRVFAQVASERPRLVPAEPPPVTAGPAAGQPPRPVTAGPALSPAEPSAGRNGALAPSGGAIGRTRRSPRPVPAARLGQPRRVRRGQRAGVT